MKMVWQIEASPVRSSQIHDVSGLAPLAARVLEYAEVASAS